MHSARWNSSTPNLETHSCRPTFPKPHQECTCRARRFFNSREIPASFQIFLRTSAYSTKLVPLCVCVFVRWKRRGGGCRYDISKANSERGTLNSPSRSTPSNLQQMLRHMQPMANCRGFFYRLMNFVARVLFLGGQTPQQNLRRRPWNKKGEADALSSESRDLTSREESRAKFRSRSRLAARHSFVVDACCRSQRTLSLLQEEACQDWRSDRSLIDDCFFQKLQ